MIAEQTAVERADNRHSADDKQKACRNEALRHGRVRILRAGVRQPVLHPFARAVHRSVQIEKLSDHGTDHNGENSDERILSLKGAADADIHGAQRKPLHDGFLQPISDSVRARAAAGRTAEKKAEKQPNGGTGENGSGVDKRSEQHGENLTFRHPL